MTSPDLSGFTMLELFRMETETQAAMLVEGLLGLERRPGAGGRLEAVLRAAHSLKGAARLVNLEGAVRVAHAMEDCLVAARQEQRDLTQDQIDVLLRGVDLLSRIANHPPDPGADLELELLDKIEALVSALASSTPALAATAESVALRVERTAGNEVPAGELSAPGGTPYARRSSDRRSVVPRAAPPAVRVAAANLNSLFGLAGESVVASHWLSGFTRELVQLKRQQRSLTVSVQGLRQGLAGKQHDERSAVAIEELLAKDTACTDNLDQRLEELELFDRRFSNLSQALYQGVLDCRMRPFADGCQGFARMVRDVARSLGKEVQFEIVGQSTAVDRDILECLEAPLGHLLRNALDHGVEPPEERLSAGKRRSAILKLEARHHAGTLLVSVTDDGRGIDLNLVRAAAVEKGLTTADVAGNMAASEVFDFLYLPGFTLKTETTEFSGRGVGLDVVQTMIKDVGGTVKVTTSPGQGTVFGLQLPLTLSVMRALLVEIAGEPYAFPLTRVSRVLKLPRDKIETIEGREHFAFAQHQIGLVNAAQVLELRQPPLVGDELSILVVGNVGNQYGVVVDRFLGERELVVRPLDPRLGKIPDISAAAMMADQSPVLIVDVDDFIRSVEILASGGRLGKVWSERGGAQPDKRKRVLVVDDSLTVRELERKLIAGNGYEVEIAVDGMDAWNAVRSGRYDLVVTDVDMPRMDGIELVTLIKQDARLRALPVMIVSYKDREQDRLRGLEAGADYYLAKASFHDETLLSAIQDLIGEAQGVRIAIVNSSTPTLEAMLRVLALAPQHSVAWTARDGAQGVALCRRDSPDLILMDPVMPVMDGVETTRRIMSTCPCAILIVTATVNQSASLVFQCLGAGAVDAVNAPTLNGDASRGGEALLAKIEIVASLLDEHRRKPPPPGLRSEVARRSTLIAIGASAGGPAALAAILAALPPALPAAIVIVQHVDAQFAASMADWLNQQSVLPVALAHSGARPQPGVALMAGTNDHLRLIGDSTLTYTCRPLGGAYRPSIDVFFESVAHFWKGPVVGVLLTGMGRDGAAGLKALRQSGAVTIAQDEATSVVYGMPRAAARLEAAGEILPLEAIAPRLIEIVTKLSRISP